MAHRNGLGRSILGLLLAIGVLLGSQSTARADTGSNWTGSYYNTQDLSGSPVFTRVDPALVFNWGPYGPGPGIGGQHWSARWTTTQFLNAGTYRFTVTVDDGARLYVDGQKILDAWHDQAPTTYTVNVAVVTGTHLLQVDYYQGVGDASLSVSWDFVTSVLTEWTAQYFNNPYLQGYPVLSRYENSINYDWGVGGSPDPSVPFNYFSARWTASLPFAAATYRFTATASNGVRLFIDGSQVINEWQIAPTTEYVIDVPLAAGIHTLDVEYFEWTGPAVIKFSYDVASGPPPYQDQSWFGEYFNNPNLQGSPVYTRDDGTSGINFNWSNSTPAPNIGHDDYSVRWTRNVYFPGRPYTFYLTSDDGARLYIDSTLIFDMWQIQAARTVSKVVDLTEGPHLLRLEYFQDHLNAVVNLTWDPPNGQNPPLAPGGGTINPPPNTGISATVNTDVLNVRNGPSTGYDVLTAITFGQNFGVVGRVTDNSWLQLNVNGTVGWSFANYLTPNGDLSGVPVTSGPSAPPPASATGVRLRTFASVRVLSGPGSSNTEMDTLPFGSEVDVVGRNSDNSWIQVNYSGITGWVYAPYVQIISGSLLSVPVTG